MHCSVQHYKTTSYQFDAQAAQIRETGPAPVGQAAGWASKLVWMLRKVLYFVPARNRNVVLCRPFRKAVTVPHMLFGPLKMLHQYLKKLQEKT